MWLLRYVYVIQSFLVGLISIVFTTVQFLRAGENIHTVLDGQKHMFIVSMETKG